MAQFAPIVRSQAEEKTALAMTCRDAAQAVEFYKKAFGAKEVYRYVDRAGRMVYADIRLGDSRFMVYDAFADMDEAAESAILSGPVMMHFHTENVDAVVGRALAAGAKLNGAIKNQFYGERGGSITDPFGHQWWVAEEVEALSLEELKDRAVAQWREQTEWRAVV